MTIPQLKEFLATLLASGQGNFISGEELRQAFNAVIDTLSDTSDVALITQESVPLPERGNNVYIATEDGYYRYFGGLKVSNEIAFITESMPNVWHKQSYPIPAQIKHVEVETATTPDGKIPTADAEIEGNTLKITLYDIKGDKGDKGDPIHLAMEIDADDIAGEGTPSATIKEVTPDEGFDQKFKIEVANLKGKQGKSAYEVWKEIDGNQDKTVEDFMEYLAKNWKFDQKAYYSSAASTIGGTCTNLASDFGVANAESNVVYLMPNTASDPSKTRMYILNDDATAFVYVGDMDINSSAFVKYANIDNLLTNPTDSDVAGAKAIMQLKAKLEGVTMEETKIALVDSGTGQNYHSGFYVKTNNSTIVSTESGDPTNGVLVVNVANAKRVRFLGVELNGSSTTVGYGFCENEPTVSIGESLDVATSFDSVQTESKKKEYLVDVPNGMNYFVVTVRVYNNQYMTLSDFYCYLQSGTNVGEELADKASYSEMNGLWRYQKNLLNNKDYITGEYYTYNDLTPTSSQYGVLSNKLFLEEGLTYTVSNIAANTNNKFFIVVVYNNNNEVVAVRSVYTVELDSEGTGYNSYGHCTFVAKKWHENQSYVRLQLQFGSELGVYNQAQLEVGKNKTDFAEYNSVKEFDIAKESDLDETAAQVASNTEDIESIKDVLEINKTIIDITNVPSKPAIIGTTTYNNNQIGSAKSIVIPIEHDKGNVLNIVARDDSGAFIAFLKEDPSDGVDYNQDISVPVTFATAHAKKFSFSRSTKSSFLITDDMNYLYVQTKSASNSNITPSLIEYITQKELNILAIGNSNDTTELAYIPPILHQLLPDYHINLYVAYVGFGTIKDHLYMYDNDIAYNGSGTTVGDGVTKNAFVYCWRYGRYYEIQLTGITLEELLELHKWHIVKFITQRSDEYALVRGVYEDDSHHNGTTKEQFITNCKKLLNILRSKLNCGFKFVTNIGGVAYTQESQYIDFLKEGCKILKNNVGVDFIIPDSLSTTIARSNSDLATISGGQKSLLFYDDNHLNAGFPCLLTAYTAIECILRNLHINKSIYDSTLWIPTDDNARAIGAQASNEPEPSTRRMTYGVSLGVEENGEIIQSNIIAAKEIATIANNIMPDLPEDDYILPPVIPEPASPEPASEE